MVTGSHWDSICCGATVFRNQRHIHSFLLLIVASLLVTAAADPMDLLGKEPFHMLNVVLLSVIGIYVLHKVIRRKPRPRKRVIFVIVFFATCIISPGMHLFHSMPGMRGLPRTRHSSGNQMQLMQPDADAAQATRRSTGNQTQLMQPDAAQATRRSSGNQTQHRQPDAAQATRRSTGNQTQLRQPDAAQATRRSTGNKTLEAESSVRIIIKENRAAIPALHSYLEAAAEMGPAAAQVSAVQSTSATAQSGQSPVQLLKQSTADAENDEPTASAAKKDEPTAAAAEHQQQAAAAGDPQITDAAGFGSGHALRVQVHVLAWNRPMSLRVLLDQLLLPSSGLDGFTYERVPLFIHIDGNSDKSVHLVASKFWWPYGEKHLDIRDTNVGLRAMWMTSLTEAARQAGPNTLMLILEDDMRLSPLCWRWMSKVVNAFGPNTGKRDSSWMGISLSPIRVNETQKPFQRWHADSAVGGDQHVYLSTLPSSWGAVYWADRWLEFADFFELRIQNTYFNTTEELRAHQDALYGDLRMSPNILDVPGARSNVWPFSWKRFMVDFMFGRGMVMLYPNLPGESGLASPATARSHHLDQAVHQAHRPARNHHLNQAVQQAHRQARSHRLVQAVHPRRNVAKSKEESSVGADSSAASPSSEHNARAGPLWAPSAAEFMACTRFTTIIRRPDKDVPGRTHTRSALLRFQDLKVFDLHCKPSSRAQVAYRGFAMLRRIMSSEPSYAPLAKAWARPDWTAPKIENEVRLCLANLFSSAKTPTSAPFAGLLPKGYLLYEAQFGLSNQIEAVGKAAVWAAILGRTLVVPPLFHPRVKEFVADRRSVDSFGTSFTDIFSVANMVHTVQQRLKLPIWAGNRSKQELSVITWEQFRTEHPKAAPTRKLSWSKQGIYDYEMSVLRDEAQWDTVSPTDLLHSGQLNFFPPDDLREYFGGCRDAVLYFSNMFFSHVQGFGHLTQTDPALSLGLQPWVSDLVKHIKGSLFGQLGIVGGQEGQGPGYACLHVRLGDFKEMCDDIKDTLAGGKIKSMKYAQRILDKGQLCKVEKPMVLEALRSFDLPAIILTDNPVALQNDPAWATGLSTIGLRTVQSPWTCNEVMKRGAQQGKQWSKNTQNILCAVVEQQLCINATKVKLNKFSTFSKRICMARNCKDHDFFTAKPI